MKKVEPVKHILKRIYGDAKGSLAFEKILPLIESFSVFKSEKQDYFSQKDVVLITYGDSLNREGEAPLETLSKFSNQYLKGLFSTIHILPFFPYS
ncbi:MAG: alpha-amylase, partial [Deltaproteobacteria bacterium]|nr:alpha-amylase [Deltaproteobacteria bacterium]